MELCKVALWLESHNPGEPLGFLDHHIKCGDSIVGLAHIEELKKGIPNEAFKALPGDDKEIASAFLKRNKIERGTEGQLTADFENTVSTKMTNLIEAFKQFNSLPENTAQEILTKEKEYKRLIESRNWQKLKEVANLMVAQFFIHKTTGNKDYLVTHASYMEYLYGTAIIPGKVQAKSTLVSGERNFFHWFLEFPEIFINGGFDCILGNPPFLGGQKLSSSFGDSYLQWLRTYYQPAGAIDLVTYFFRRIFKLIKPEGFQSLIATNTIAQGSAREGGLDVIVKAGGTINHAVKSMRWPGLAAVEVALVSIHKGSWLGPFFLSQKAVNQITSYLDNADSFEHPYPLKQNVGKSFQGSIVLGKGFILEKNEAKALIDKNPQNSDVIFPYLNGDDLNNIPSQKPSRFIINFFCWPIGRYSQEHWGLLAQEQRDIIEQNCREGKSEKWAPPFYNGPVAEDYPDCLSVLKNLVEPIRKKDNRECYRDFWWHYAEKRPALYNAISELEKVLVSCRVSKYVNHSLSQVGKVFDVATNVVLRTQFHEFAILQSSLQNEWAWKYSSTLESRIRYVNVDCIDTFPFPLNLDLVLNELNILGLTHYEHRRQLLLSMQLGLTKTYNLIHSKNFCSVTEIDFEFDDKSFEKKFGKDALHLKKHLTQTPGTISFNEAVAGIFKLRELHVEMDNAVLEAYGWSDVELRHDFYEVDYLPENDRVRYTIHPDARKEILKRLLELNHTIHEEEVAAGLWDKKGSSKKGKKPAPETGSVQEPEGGYGGLFEGIE
ncbi:MAG: hypothetical protein JXA23_02060 [Bacteroidales bacterium]|nr:hypothetical protein [Bacteroidales bacterium]